MMDTGEKPSSTRLVSAASHGAGRNTPGSLLFGDWLYPFPSEVGNHLLCSLNVLLSFFWWLL